MAITGSIEAHRDGRHLALSREFRRPIDDVWAALTEPSQLAGWIGTWSGDPASGSVEFRMVYEGDGPATPTTIEACSAPTRLRVHTHTGTPEFDWILDVRLSRHEGVTHLSLWQPIGAGVNVADVGPGWEYYLDRLAAYLDTGSASGIVWDAYPALGAEYAKLT